MKKLLAIVVLGLLFSGNAYTEKKFLLCKDKIIVPQNDLSNSKNEFFSSDGEVLTISYGEKITKIWANNMSIVQFTLIDKDDSYKFEFPKNVFYAQKPGFLNFEDKTFFDHQTGDSYKFRNGSLNKMTLEGFLYYRIENQKTPVHSRSRTRDFLSISFKCEITNPKI